MEVTEFKRLGSLRERVVHGRQKERVHSNVHQAVVRVGPKSFIELSLNERVSNNTDSQRNSHLKVANIHLKELTHS